MPVYVSTLKPSTPSLAWPYKSLAIMTGWNRQEVHELGQIIGLPVACYRNGCDHWGDLPHYKLTSTKHRDAIRAGAEEDDFMVEEIRAYRRSIGNFWQKVLMPELMAQREAAKQEG